MHPANPSQVFVAASNEETLQQLLTQNVIALEHGQIGGLNGVLLGVAAEKGLHGGCLLGEMPHFFSQLPYPKASLAILEVFSSLTGIPLDFEELAAQAKMMDEQLGTILEQLEEKLGQSILEKPEEKDEAPPSPMEKLTAEDHQHLDELFDQAVSDRSKSFELKRELDRLGVFKEFEDRFLDLFKH
jgi:hypothetical protein